VVDTNMDALAWLRKQLDGDESDLLREMVAEFARRLMATEVDTVTGAGWGEVSPERVNHRNGFRQRPFDTRVGSVELAIPKLRRGSYFLEWLLDPRRRAEKALVAVVAECYVRGVSTRRVDGLVKTLGIELLSKSQVSRMAGELRRAGARWSPWQAPSGGEKHLATVLAAPRAWPTARNLAVRSGPVRPRDRRALTPRGAGPR
jgi:putative transposase